MKRLTLLLALCLAFLPACSGTTSPSATGTARTEQAASTTAPPPAPTPTEAPSGLHVTVTDTGGKAVPGASVSLTDMRSLEIAAAATDTNGAADFGEQSSGSRSLSVSAPGFLDSGSGIELTGEYQNVGVQLKPAVTVKRYLMALTAVSAADKISRVYLAQSGDGFAWEAFPGFTPFEEKGGAGVAARDGMIYVYTETAIRRYRIASGEWDIPRPYTLHIEEYFNGKGAVNYTALTREPSLFLNSSALMLVGAHTRTNPFGYADSGLNNNNMNDISLVGLASERKGSLGLIFRYKASRYLYKDKFAFSQTKSRDIGSPFVIVSPEAYYLLMSKNNGITVQKSDKAESDFQNLAELKNSQVYTGANNGATGYLDAATNKFILLVSVNEGGKAAIKRFALDSLTASAPGPAADIDLSFLGGAVTSAACPAVWDSGNTENKPAEEMMTSPGFAQGWDPGNAFIATKYGGTQTGTSGSDTKCILDFSKNTYWVYSYVEAVYSSFTVAVDVRPGTNTVAEGIAYCWNPAGVNVGGFLFTVDGKAWSLSVLEPTAGARGIAISPIRVNRVLLTGSCPESAAGCTLTVRHSLGLHELYVNGKKVGEYEDTDAEKALGAGFIGVYAASGDQQAEIEFNALKILS